MIAPEPPTPALGVGPVRCVLAARRGLFADGVGRLLETEAAPDLRLAGRASEPAETEAVVRRCRAHVAIVAFEPVRDAVEVSRQLPVPVVLLSSSADPADFLGAFEAGVAAFLRNDVEMETLAQCVRKVRHGEACFPSGWRRSLVDAMNERSLPEHRLSELTRRERSVVDLVLDGQSNKQIARSLGLAQQTIKNHMHAIMTKANVSSRVQLCLWCLGTEAASSPAPAWSSGPDRSTWPSEMARAHPLNQLRDPTGGIPHHDIVATDDPAPAASPVEPDSILGRQGGWRSGSELSASSPVLVHISAGEGCYRSPA
jgi:DNA-binding NarL/FixJ family response regulator